MNLYISDLHFGHKNVIRFDGRPYKDVDEMDHTLIEMWNSRVNKDDTVYIVGDLCHRSARPPHWYLSQLAGHKILIVGNHDHPVLKDGEAMRMLEDVQKILVIKDEDEKVILCHYPIAEWNGYHRGSWLIYGHIHNRTDEAYQFMKTKERALNAGCMINGYMPASMKELIRNNERFKMEN